MPKLFSYGTLCDPFIQNQILDRELPGTPAEAQGYTLKEIIIEGKKYPAAYESVTGKITGSIFEINDVELQKIDDYEGDSYKRIHDPTLQAWLYILAS